MIYYMYVATLIIDGNNLIHSVPYWSGLGSRGASFPTVRVNLVRKLAGLSGIHCQRLIIIFDGTVPGRDDALSSGAVTVEYMAAHDSADRKIEKLIGEAKAPEDVLVVSSDRTLRNVASGFGAQTMSCEDFVDEMKPLSNAPRENHKRQTGTGKFSIGDAFDRLGI
jgi:predicted RNA-binding protein with PIN domain